MARWPNCRAACRRISLPQNQHAGGNAVPQSHVFAGVGGYYGGSEGKLAGVFRRDAEGEEWHHVLSEAETYSMLVHPRDPDLVLAGTADGVYRSTDRGATFKRADF